MAYEEFTPAFKFNDTSILAAEKEYFSDQLDEACLLYGPVLKYIDITHAQPDYVFGEYLANTIEEGESLQLMCEQIDDEFYPEDSGIFGKFGYTPQLDTATFFGSTNYFEHLSIVPQEDDLIYYAKIDKIFEIVKVTLLDDYKYKIDSRLYNYDHMEVSDDVTDQPILDIEDINDDEVTKIVTPITTQIETEDIIDDDDSDGLYG